MNQDFTVRGSVGIADVTAEHEDQIFFDSQTTEGAFVLTDPTIAELWAEGATAPYALYEAATAAGIILVEAAGGATPIVNRGDTISADLSARVIAQSNTTAFTIVDMP